MSIYQLEDGSLFMGKREWAQIRELASDSTTALTVLSTRVYVSPYLPQRRTRTEILSDSLFTMFRERAAK